MPQLSQIKVQPHSHKVLICAPSGTGKTGLIGTLANAGYRVFLADFENGWEVLRDPLIVKPAAASNLYIKTFTDPPLSKSEINMQTAFRDFVKCCNEGWIEELQPKAFTNLGTPKSWGNRDVLVIDTLGKLSECALNYVRFVNNHHERATLPDIGNAMDMMLDLIDLLTGPNNHAHLVVLSHITFVSGPEQAGVVKGFPLSLGNKLPPKIPRAFNSMLSLERRIAADKTDQRYLLTRATPLLDLKTPAPSIVPAEMQADLAAYFKLLDSVQTTPIPVAPTPSPAPAQQPNRA